MNCQLIWKFHLQHLEKKTSKRLSVLTALTGSTWNIGTNDLRRIYFATVLPQFTYCASVWYVPFGGHGFKQKQDATFTTMRGLQARAARIIAGAFKSTAGSALNVELFLLLIEQQLDKVIFNSFLRIKTSFRYEFIISHRTLSDRDLSPNMTQHQRSLYAQLSPLHKLKRRYASILDQSLTPLERHIPFPMAPWWNVFQTTIASTAEKAIATHNVLLASDGHFVIYTDGSGIDSKVGASAVTMITPIPGEPPIVADKRQAFLNPLSKFTVYCGELVGIDIALDIIKDNPQNRPVAIFTDNQAAILAVRKPGHQSGQYVLVQIASKIQTLDVTIHIH